MRRPPQPVTDRAAARISQLPAATAGNVAMNSSRTQEASSTLAPIAQRRRRTSPRSKRDAIIATATEYFGHHGYEYSKWADVAGAVGIGSTALYHYFESKLHCLYEIQALAVQADREKFDRVTAEHEDFAEALKAVLDAAFDLTELEVLRNRVLVAEQSLVGVHRTSPRE